MREMTLEEVKKTEIEILDVIAKFCDERKINYWIDCGTLLGAIRHKGFIPWDDDIDVGMLRPDYDRFMKEFNGYSPRYEFHCLENDSDWLWAYGKVIDNDTVMYEHGHSKEIFDAVNYGVYVDVFIYDNAPDDDNAMRKMFRKRDFLHLMSRARLNNIFFHSSGNIFRRLSVRAVRMMLRLFNKNYFVRKVFENSRRYISENTKRVGNFAAVNYMVCDKDAFDSFIEVEFEGKKYKAPAGYDKWLRAFYGDYMQLPPVEQRVGHHHFTAYWKS